MEITLTSRTADHVRQYWEKSQDPEIQEMLPSAADSLEASLKMFEESQQPGAKSFGQVILADGAYVGDIWCYGIDEEDEKMAMLSFCIFEKSVWHKGICTKAVELFLPLAFEKYQIEKMGAFTFSDNLASIGTLKKTGFQEREEFTEEGRLSKYFEKEKSLP